MSAPGVSVIVNVLDGGSTLGAALETLRAQTWTNFEAIIADDVSADGSLDIARSFADPRFHCLALPARVPLGAARSQAIAAARAPWLAFLDQDDLWLPDKLSRQMALVAQGGPRLGLVYGRATAFDDRGRTRDADPVHEFSPLPEGDLLPELLAHGNFIAMSSALVRKQALERAGGLPPDIEVCPDYAAFLLVARDWEALALQEPCCFYRRHAAGLSVRAALRSHQECLTLVERHADAAPPALLAGRRRVYAALIGWEELRAGSIAGVRRIARHGALPYLASRPFARAWRACRRAVRARPAGPESMLHAAWTAGPHGGAAVRSPEPGR